MRKLWRISCLLSLLVLFSACTSQATVSPRKIIYGLTLNPSGIDPHINRSTELGIVLRQVYDTLVYRHPDTREFVGGLAESWEISADRLIYTFYLKQNVLFHDGTAFNAQAVGANLNRILAPETASQRSRFLIEPLASYEIVDDYTIRMVLNRPFEPFLDSLSQVYLAIASPNALAEYNTLRYQYHQIGTGPFQFVEYIPEEKIVIRRNPNYAWGPDFYGELPENAVQEIEFRFFTDAATRLLALENGDAHIMGELLPTDARSLVANRDVLLLPVSIPGLPLQFYINTSKAPTDDLLVRQALAYAANRTSIVDAVFGGFSPVAWGPVSAPTLFYNRGVQNVYAYDLQQAQTLLSQAGFADSNSDGILDRNGEDLVIKLLHAPWGNLPEVSQFLQDQWQSIGIRVEVNLVPGYPALIEAVTEGDYHLVSFDQPGIDPYILNQSYLSTSQDNWTHYANPELDSVLLDAMANADPQARRLAYGRAQAIILEQALIIPIREYVNLNAHSVKIKHLRYDPYGWFPLLYGVSLES